MTTKEKLDLVTDLLGWSKVVDEISTMITREELESFYDCSTLGDTWRECKVERLEEILDEFIILEDMEVYFSKSTMDKFIAKIIDKHNLEGYFNGEILRFKMKPRIDRGQIHIELK